MSSSCSSGSRASGFHLQHQIALTADPLDPRNCYCKERARLYTSFKPWSLGRRFLGCPNYRRFKLGLCSKKCGLFVWVDDELHFPVRASELILELRERELALLDENETLRRKIELLVSEFQSGKDAISSSGKERLISEMVEAAELRRKKKIEEEVSGHVRKFRMQGMCMGFVGFMLYYSLCWLISEN